MKVALVHYHLRTGGVTKVIVNQCRALAELGHEVLVFSAGKAPGGIPHQEVPLLDYLAVAPDEPVSLYQELLQHCETHFGSSPDLWHFHNHSLGKNVLFPELVQAVAESETPLILQPHDFAEDNRPSNYPLLAGEEIYPLAPQIQYAFINSRDRALLEEVGLPEGNSHLLPNAVNPPATVGSRADNEAQTLVLYPVRGIRRKNLGEAVLLAALAPPETRFAISLAPENPAWQGVHQNWERFSDEHHLPIDFAVTDRIPPCPGASADFQTWLHYSTHLLTTSIAEGFGLAFLEPAALQKPLIGRDLPEITKDFYQQGIRPGRLYENIPVPLSLLDVTELRREFEHQVSNSYRLYEQKLSDAALDEGWQKLTQGDKVDFGALPESFQQRLILKSLPSPGTLFEDLRQWLAGVLQETQPTAKAGNLSNYLLPQTQLALANLYRAASEASPAPPIWLPKENVLAQYLSPDRFHFLRS